MSIYQNDVLVGELTDRAIKQSQTRLFQLHRFAPDDTGHVAELLATLNPPQRAFILDVGCGVGEMARQTKKLRPDLDFILTNASQAQLDRCPPDFKHIRAVAEDLPFHDQSFDGVLVTYVLGHLDVEAFAAEAARLLPFGGCLMVYDLFIIQGDSESRLKTDLSYNEWTFESVRATLERHGLNCVRHRRTNEIPPTLSTLLPHPETLANTHSVAAVFIKE